METALFSNRKEATREYAHIVNTPRELNDFGKSMEALTEKYPYFVIPYLERLEFLERIQDRRNYHQFLLSTEGRLGEFIYSPKTISEIADNSTFRELHAFKHLINRIKRIPKGIKKTYLIYYAEQTIKDALRKIAPLPPKKHLTCVEDNINTQFIADELSNNEHLWYADTYRQDFKVSHKNTQIIKLRVVQNMVREPVIVDPPHESTRTPYASHFKETTSYIENFARKQGCGLGRVAFVRLRPNSIVYAHSDMQPSLQDRDRYHLVISAQAGNILFSGNEARYPKAGQLLKYGNKAVHKSYNESNEWRTHIIFDMFPAI